MEIGNTKQPAETKPINSGNVGDPDIMKIMPFVPYDIQDEISALYKSIPEIANHFLILDKIGEGAFSSVYQARLKHYPEVTEMFALKHILPTTHPARIENELRCLLKLGGQDNVMGVKLCLRNRDNVVIVMDYFAHERFQDILNLMSVNEARDYMKNLLVALKRIHQHKVIHRDVKPSNFLYNRNKKQYALVDFGLASGHFLIDREGEKQKTSTPVSASNARVPLSPSKANITQTVKISPPVNKFHESTPLPRPIKKQSSFCVPASSSAGFLEKSGLCNCLGKPKICSLCIARKNQMAPRAGTAGFRAPEVLLKSPEQDTAVDIWAAGTTFLSILSARYPFFRAQDDTNHLAQIISVLGSAACVEAAKTFGKVLTLSENLPPLDLRTTCLKLRSSQMSTRLGSSSFSPAVQHPDDLVHSWSNVPPEAFDLLARMLDPNPCTRITAEEALRHPFFTECGAS
ncbi:cell division cycle 7-related protein kinase-like [Plakobranchus ocellatus]|uniref:non-specific serine/threonine protein kinase n=1 Tax=Plakobranchus ocellatus TaxID=259542 RepID=A0AAV3Y598_9GAST|nr:cell division cycle 7-related protein kinase-like [Plakobranchus ocellatus]